MNRIASLRMKAVYDLNPKRCPQCGAIISYYTRRHTFCGMSCAKRFGMLNETPESRAHRTRALRGRSRPQSVRDKISAARKGRPWPVDQLMEWALSDECRALMSKIGKEHGANNGRKGALPPYDKALRHRFRYYKYGAIRRGHAWEFSLDDFAALVTRECWYCGVEPMHTTPRCSPDVKFNGVDRVDNSVGYISGNVVSCCGDCNRAKRIMSVDSFLAMARRIAMRHP